MTDTVRVAMRVDLAIQIAKKIENALEVYPDDIVARTVIAMHAAHAALELIPEEKHTLTHSVEAD
jgi:hypothetical protein